MVPLLAQAARVPPLEPLLKRLVVQIVLLALRKQNLRLLRQTRHVRKSRRPAARAPAHEALLRLPVEGFRANVARLALRVGRALLDRDRDRLLVFFVGVVLFRAATALDLLAEGFVAALLPVQLLAVLATVARLAYAASEPLVFEGRSARGALCQDHSSAGLVAREGSFVSRPLGLVLRIQPSRALHSICRSETNSALSALLLLS